MDLLPCAECGQLHPPEDTELSFQRPDKFVKTPFWKRIWKTRCNGDLCILLGREQFIYGIVRFPVIGTGREYGVGLWVQVDEESFERYVEYYNSDQLLPFEGRVVGSIANEIPELYERSSVGTAVEIFAVPNKRPTLKVLDETHELFLEQRDGICPHRVHDFLSLLFRQ